jgi:hypothetical protein
MSNEKRIADLIELTRRAELGLLTDVGKSNLYQFLSLDSSGVSNSMNVDGTTPVLYKYQAPPGKKVWLTRLIIHIADNAAFSGEEYGGGAGLTNGIEIFTAAESTPTTPILQFTPLPIKTNVDWGRYCYDIAYQAWSNVNNRSMQGRWTFAKSGSIPVIDGDNLEFLGTYVRDDLSGLVDHTLMLQGYIVDK